MTALIGPSGCGKSTYLRCLNRMNDIIAGCRVTGTHPARRRGHLRSRSMDVVHLRARVGMVFQKPNPFPKSIYENVAYGPRIHGLAKDKDELDEIVQTQPGARPACGRRSRTACSEPGTGLSGGQQQRLCIARAIAVQPGGDPDGRALLGARPDRHRPDRGADRRAARRTTPSSSSPTRCSRRRASRSAPASSTSASWSRPARPSRSSPIRSDKRTQDYITGRFG